MKLKCCRAFAAVLLLLSGCRQPISLPGAFSETVRIRLPDYPSAPYPELEYWLAVWYEDGHIRTRFLPAGTEYITADVLKNKTTPFLFYPYIETAAFDGERVSSGFFKPGGCIYPISLNADWRQGVGSFILYTVLRQDSGGGAQDFTSRFNWNKLLQVINEKTADAGVYGNDNWHADMRKITEALVSGSFSKSDVSLYTETECEAQIPAAGGGIFFYPYIPAGFTEIQSGGEERGAVFFPRYEKQPEPEQFLFAADAGGCFILAETLGMDGKKIQGKKITLAITAPQ